MQAEHIDAHVIRREALAVKWIDAANFTEEMPRSFCVKPVFGDRVSPGKKRELRFMHLDHERILAAANRAVAGGEFRKIGFDLEANGTAVTTASVSLKRSVSHF